MNSVKVNDVQESSTEGVNFGVKACLQVHPPDKADGGKVSLSVPADIFNLGFTGGDRGLQKYFQK